ncbi:GumC family protein [Winogradskyella luteola]|uniref:non-specific protein-tyrosine kinase n=1 Tax=Winogradskyella luteola TaxID=2828330 RepID=A0A9X1F6Q0_9FLAO|nr:polysaccharide biosynthesis tyrosine autokinase [Winogradskyella luteola]MBV7268159.1 polysaccharide biosynthesis tyrosine autokinase [Winogradskyella luteola]
MESKPNSVTADIKQRIELFLSYWKWIVLCVVLAIALGFTYLRYTTYEYKATATIKIRDEKQANKLPSIEEINSEGLFSGGTDKIKDEIQIIKSRTLMANIIKMLNLNIRVFEQGKIKEKELYVNPPVSVSFFESDSVIHNTKANLYLKIKSDTEFILFKDDGKSFIDRDESEGKVYAFGDKIETSYGGIVVVPNVGSHAPRKGSNLKITITPVVKLVSHYQKSVSAFTEKGSSVVELELKETVAQKAVDFLDQLIIEYNNDVLHDKEEVVRVTSEFINKRLEQVQEELGEVESNAQQIQQQNNLTDLGSQTNLNLQAKKQLEQQISTTATNIQMISYLQEEMNDENKISDMLPANVGIGDSNTAQIIKSHNDLVAKRDKLLKTSTAKNPTVVQLNNQIDALKNNLESSLSSIKKTSELTLNNLNSESNRISGQLYAAPSKARKFRGIQRQQDIKESLYLYLLEKREESAIRLGMYQPSAKIVDSAYSSYKPVAPNKTITYLASFIFGLMIPLGLIYVSDLLDTKLYRKDDLVNILDIPYLGDIPKSPKKMKLVKKADYSPRAEAFRIVRSNVDFMLKGVSGRAKKLFVTSTKAQEGKSHTSTNLATSISYSNKSVLLIEMDIRVPKILDYLDIKEKPKKGLTDFLADNSVKPQDIVMKQKDNSFFDIIPSGTIPPNPSELLMSDRVEELFKHFEKKYDYIIADTSAVGLVSDTLLISKYADMFIYVVSADGVDKRQLVHVAKTLYDEKRLPNMTMLLNGVKHGKKGYGYGYGYGNNPNKKKKWYQFS